MKNVQIQFKSISIQSQTHQKVLAISKRNYRTISGQIEYWCEQEENNTKAEEKLTEKNN